MTNFRPLPTDRRARVAVLDDYMGVAHKLAPWSAIETRADLYATVELAWGLILSLIRHIPEESRMRSGAWQTRLGDAPWGKTIGIIGLGMLRTRMAGVAKEFGMEALAWSPNLTPERAAAAGATYVDKQELLSTADVVSSHLVLGPSTRGIIGAGDLALMKPTALLINTSRGPLVDELALLNALRDRRIGGAGVDVYDQEPLAKDHPIRFLPNVIATPHLGYSVRDTFERFYGETVENLESWLDGRPIRLADGGQLL